MLTFSTNCTMNLSGIAISLPAKEIYTIKTSVRHNPKNTPKALKKNFINQIIEYVEALLATNLEHYVLSFYLFISYFS
jgi:hypothetical protein